MESIWEWMKNNQSKFSKGVLNESFLMVHDKDYQREKLQVEKLNQLTKKEPQKSLDSYLRKNSILFDENFTQEDFTLITRQWKQKNLIMN